MKRYIFSISLALLFVFVGCSKGVVYDKSIMIKDTIRDDSVHVALTIRNMSKDSAVLYIFPECDCTKVNPDQIQLKAHTNQNVMISFYLNSSSYFERLVYLLNEKTEKIDTIVIRGNLKR